MGRNTQGVTLMDVDDGDRIVSIGMIEPDENGDAAAPAADAASAPPAPEPPPAS
jgi:hypothetical protein